MKLDDVLELLESDPTDEHKARRKAAYFHLHQSDERQHRVNRKSKHDFDDETNEINHQEKRHPSRYDRSKRL